MSSLKLKLFMPVLALILVVFFALPFQFSGIQPSCAINRANAQDSPCLSQESTITAQELRILQLESTVAAYEQNRTAYLANLIGLWASTDGQYVTSWRFRNGGNVEVTSQVIQQTGTYIAAGDSLSLFLFNPGVLLPTTLSLKIVDATENDIVLEVIGENRNILLTRVDELALTATQSVIPTSTSTPTRTPEPTSTPRPTSTPSSTPTITPTVDPVIPETIDRWLDNWGGRLVEQQDSATVDLTGVGLITENLFTRPVRWFVVKANITVGPGNAGDSCGLYLMPDKATHWYGVTLRRDGSVLQLEWIIDDIEVTAISTDTIKTGAGEINQLMIIGLEDKLIIIVNDQRVTDFEPILMERGRIRIIGVAPQESGADYCEINNAWLWDLAAR